MKNQTNYLWLVLLVLLLVGCSTSSAVTPVTNRNKTSVTLASTSASLPNTAKIDTYLSGLAVKGALSGSVLVAHDGAVFAKGYGVADRDAHILNTAQTRFRLGSVSKQFTAMAILLLQEQGKIRVQDMLCHYMPACPAAWQTITVEQLLVHGSGIPDYTNFADFAVTWTKAVSVERLIARFKDKPLEFTPGSHFRYSSSGYVLLGYLIERVSGVSYATFLQKHIFEPLGLHNTGYDVQYPTLPQHATGYYDGYVKPDPYDLSVLYAAGALYSTVEDLYTWDEALMTHKLLPQGASSAMFAQHVTCPPPGSSGGCLQGIDRGYGYGWFLAQAPQGRLVYHEGRIDGFLSYNGFYPANNIVVVVLSNLETTDYIGIAGKLAGMV